MCFQTSSFSYQWEVSLNTYLQSCSVGKNCFKKGEKKVFLPCKEMDALSELLIVLLNYNQKYFCG